MWVPSGLQEGRTDEVPSAVTCRIAPAASATCALASPPTVARHHRRKINKSGALPLIGVSLPERLEYRSFDQALGDVDFVRIQAHRPRHGANLGRCLLGGRLDVLALQGILDHLRAVG